MALTKLQIFHIYLERIPNPLLSTRIEQMYNLLTAGQKTAVWNTIKSDLLAVLNEDKDEVTENFNSQVTPIDSQITDVTASVP